MNLFIAYLFTSIAIWFYSRIRGEPKLLQAHWFTSAIIALAALCLNGIYLLVAVYAGYFTAWYDHIFTGHTQLAAYFFYGNIILYLFLTLLNFKRSYRAISWFQYLLLTSLATSVFLYYYAEMFTADINFTGWDTNLDNRKWIPSRVLVYSLLIVLVDIRLKESSIVA